MKKLFILIGVIACMHANAQVKEGFIKYSMKLEGGEETMAASMMGNSAIILYFKNEKSVSEMTSAIYNVKTVSNDKETLVLMDAAGQKSFTRQPKDAAVKNKTATAADYNVVFTQEKKKVLGYVCTKAVVTRQNGKNVATTMNIWFTDKIQAVSAAGIVDADVLAKLKGMPLEVETGKGNSKVRIAAIEISVLPVADAIFTPSTAGYTERKK